MHRKFIALVCAASIALTALGAAPAAADQRQTNQALAALLGLAVVGAIIHENRKDRDERRGQPQHHQPQPVYKKPRDHGYVPPVYHKQPQPRPLPDRAARKILPQECFRSYETYRGKVRMFPRKCLQRHYRHADRLPRACEYIFNTSRGDRRGYEARCLKDKGYRLARR